MRDPRDQRHFRRTRARKVEKAAIIGAGTMDGAYATHLAIFGQTFIVLAFVSPAGPELTFAESGALECEPGCLKVGYPYGLPRLSEGELRQRFDRFASGR